MSKVDFTDLECLEAGSLAINRMRRRIDWTFDTIQGLLRDVPGYKVGEVISRYEAAGLHWTITKSGLGFLINASTFNEVVYTGAQANHIPMGLVQTIHAGLPVFLAEMESRFPQLTPKLDILRRAAEAV